MKVKVSEAEGAVLNKLVNMADGLHGVLAPVEYSTRWEFGGPLIERECIEVSCIRTAGWTPNSWDAKHPQRIYAKGPTPLIAAMRCYVASKLGDEVTIPEEVK